MVFGDALMMLAESVVGVEVVVLRHHAPSPLVLPLFQVFPYVLYASSRNCTDYRLTTYDSPPSARPFERE